MASWIYPQPQWHWRGAGAVVSIAAHLAVIAWLLALRMPTSSQPLPTNVTIIGAEPQAQSQPLEMSLKPHLDSPTLQVPQPDITLADNIESDSAPIATANAASIDAEPVAPTQTQPAFDADYLNNPAPAYPPLARRLREEGVVYVRVFVSAEGWPDQIELRRSSGSARLDEAALMTVKKWRFVPARRGAQTIAAWVVVPIAFSLTV